MVRLFEDFFSFFAAAFFFGALVFLAVDFAVLVAALFTAGSRFPTAFLARFATTFTAVSASAPAA